MNLVVKVEENNRRIEELKKMRADARQKVAEKRANQ